MKLKIKKEDLQGKLNTISAILPTRSAKPITECILMELKGNELKLSATDLSLTYTTLLDVEGLSDGLIIVPGKQFTTIIKGMPNNDITLEQDGTSLKISTGAIKFKVAITENNDEFPKEPEQLETNRMDIDSLKLRKFIEKTIFATSNDELRAVMTGVLFSIANNEFKAVATDSVRLIKLEDKDLRYNGEDIDVIIPSKALRIIQNSNELNTPCEVFFSEYYMQINLNNETIFCRLINGKYPAYQSIIPKSHETHITLDKASLIEGLSRISITTNPLTKLILLNFSKGLLEIVSEDTTTTSSAKELIALENYDGSEIRIGFNAEKLIETIKHITGDKIILSMNGSTTPAIVRPSEDSKIYEMMALLMPVRVVK